MSLDRQDMWLKYQQRGWQRLSRLERRCVALMLAQDTLQNGPALSDEQQRYFNEAQRWLLPEAPMAVDEIGVARLLECCDAYLRTIAED